MRESVSIGFWRRAPSVHAQAHRGVRIAPMQQLLPRVRIGRADQVDPLPAGDLKQSDIQKWVETFLEFGRRGLRVNPKNAESAYEEELKAHREKIGELVLQIDVLKKAKKVLEDSEEENSSSE